MRNPLAFLFLLLLLSQTTIHASHDFGDIQRPLFVDPNYHGSCDLEIVWNEHTQEWWIFYTARRAKRENATYVGTPI